MKGLKDLLYKPWPSGNSKSPFSQTLVDCMRKLRAEGKSLKEIATLCEVSSSAVHKYVKGIVPSKTEGKK